MTVILLKCLHISVIVGSSVSETRLLMLQDYLKDFWPALQAAHELYSSISQVLQEKESEGSQKEFTEHLPAEVLEAGIKSGRYIKVKHRSSSHSDFVWENWVAPTM